MRNKLKQGMKRVTCSQVMIMNEAARSRFSEQQKIITKIEHEA